MSLATTSFVLSDVGVLFLPIFFLLAAFVLQLAFWVL
jgi:hypothetical protein